MDADRNQVVERIRKLLALAGNNPSVEEATAAALKAQKLMAENKIEEYELAGEDEMPVGVESTVGQHKGWRFMLARVVAANFRCEYYVSADTQLVRTETTRRRSMRTESRDVVFFGYRADAEAAKLTFEYLFGVGERLADKAARAARVRYGTASGVRNSFARGFCGGVRSELEIQAHALMIVVPPKVSESYKGMTLIAMTRGCMKAPERPIAAYVDEGYRAGRDAVRASRLRGDNSDWLLDVPDIPFD